MQKEIALYTASKVNSEFCWFDIDGDIDPLFKVIIIHRDKDGPSIGPVGATAPSNFKKFQKYFLTIKNFKNGPPKILKMSIYNFIFVYIY